MADNLLLLDGDNSNAGSGLEKSSNVQSRNGNGNNTREQEEPGILRFARRNRSRTANNAVRSAVLPSKDAAKPCTNDTSKTVQPEEEKEREKDEPKSVSPVSNSNSKPESPRKSEHTLSTVQPEEIVATEREDGSGPTQMDVDANANARAEEAIEQLSEKAEAPTMTVPVENVENEKEVVNMNMDVDVSENVSNRCNDELPAPSAVLLNDDNTYSKGVPVPASNSNCTADNGLIENGGSGTVAMETTPAAEELDSKVVVQLDSVIQIKDEKEEEIRVEKPSSNETIVEVESTKEDSCIVEPAKKDADADAVVPPPPPVSEVAAAAAAPTPTPTPTAEEVKVMQKEHEDEILEKAHLIEVCNLLLYQSGKR